MSFSVTYHDCEPPKLQWNIGSYGFTGFKGVRTVKTAWTDSEQFCMEVLSPSNAAWPYGNATAYAISATIESFPNAKMMDGGDGLVQFEYARITVEYTSNAIEIEFNGEKVLGYEKASGALRVEPICPTGLYWGTSSGPPVEASEAPGHDFPYANYVLGFSGVSYIPASVFTLFGCSNASAFPTLTMGYTFPVETLKYQGLTTSKTFTLGGSDGWKIELDFGSNPHGWNYFWRPSAGEYQVIVNKDGTRYKPVVPGNLRALLS